jgi:hypothetical protein
MKELLDFAILVGLELWGPSVHIIHLQTKHKKQEQTETYIIGGWEG